RRWLFSGTETTELRYLSSKEVGQWIGKNKSPKHGALQKARPFGCAFCMSGGRGIRNLQFQCPLSQFFILQNCWQRLRTAQRFACAKLRPLPRHIIKTPK